MLSCAIYLGNLRFVSTGDTAAARYIPFSILMRGRLDVDPWIEPYLEVYRSGKVPWGIYFATQSHGHWMSIYPVLGPLVVTPLYVPASLWLLHKATPVSAAQMMFYAEAMEKLSGAVIAAIGVSIFYLALRKVVSPRASVVISAIFAFASPTWNISSQSLWLHGMTELCFALLLWALVNLDERPVSFFWVGLALALAMANKPTNAVVALPIIVYVLWRHPRRALPLFVPIFLVGTMTFSYNLYFFNDPFGGYNQAFHGAGYGNLGDAFNGNIFTGMAGLLVSPSRGALWFYPWVVFAAWGALRMWRQQPWPWARFLVSSAVLFFLTYSKVGRWYGGYCFGPRYLTDIMPLAAFFLVPLWPTLEERRAPRALFACAVVAAFAVQIVGVFYYPNGGWDDLPVSVDVQTSRLWDWHDPQIVRTFMSGPAKTKLFRHLQGE